MPQAFQARKFFIPKTDPKQEVYKPVPYYFGTLSTQDAADQIAEESSLTKGDVLNVLDRYQRYVIGRGETGAFENGELRIENCFVWWEEFFRGS